MPKAAMDETRHPIARQHDGRVAGNVFAVQPETEASPMLRRFLA